MNLLTVKEVCEQLNISRWTVSRLVDSGQLKASKIGRIYRFKQSDIDEFLKNNAVIVEK